MRVRRGGVLVGWFIAVGLCGVLGLVGRGASRAEDADAKPGKGIEPKAEEVLRRAADLLKKARSIEVEVEKSQNIGPAKIEMTFNVAVRRPNRFAIRTKLRNKGMGLEITVISDGEKLFTSIPALKKYTEADAPETLEALGGDPITAQAIQSIVIQGLCSDDPYAKLMDGVTSAKYAGLETLDDAKAHHLKLSKDQFDWEIWVAADGDPLIRRTVMDLSRAMAKLPGAEQFKNQKMELVEDLTHWKIDREIDKDTFVFQPPKGSEKVDSFIPKQDDAEEKPSPLLGAPAPDVNLKRLDKGEFRLEDQRDKNLVMLDFWATWCGPCVMEMPILAEVAESYKDKGVVLCAVNQREKPAEIEKFLKEKKLKITVALDSEGEVGESYQVRGIPTLVLIDKKGVVQSVHVGYSPAIKATLKKELDALLSGKDLAKEALSKVKKKEKPAAKLEGLESAWTADGAYAGVATDPTGRLVYALLRQGRCDVLDPEGKATRTFRLPGARTTGRIARLTGKDSEALLSFTMWGPSVLASKSDGTTLWQENGGQGIDDVCVADLDGDGVDEVIVGYNGDTGLHAFSPEGKRLWKRTDLGNVWHVAVGDLDGDGKVEVVSTSAQGKVHVTSPKDGHALRTMNAGLYANMVRIAPASKGDVVLVIGTGEGGQQMVALSGAGKTLWTLDLPGTNHCDSLEVSPDGTWAAAGLRGGSVRVVDLKVGQVVAQVADQGTTPMVAWDARDKTKAPLLLIANGKEVGAYRVKPAAPAEEKP